MTHFPKPSFLACDYFPTEETIAFHMVLGQNQPHLQMCCHGNHWCSTGAEIYKVLVTCGLSRNGQVMRCEGNLLFSIMCLLRISGDKFPRLLVI